MIPKDASVRTQNKEDVYVSNVADLEYEKGINQFAQ